MLPLPRHSSLLERSSTRLLDFIFFKKKNKKRLSYLWFVFHGSIKVIPCKQYVHLTCLPAKHGTFKWESTPQRPHFYGWKGRRKQDVSHFVSKWITTVQCAASYLQATPGWPARWLTRPLSKQATPSNSELELAPFAINVSLWYGWKFTDTLQTYKYTCKPGTALQNT